MLVGSFLLCPLTNLHFQTPSWLFVSLRAGCVLCAFQTGPSCLASCLIHVWATREPRARMESACNCSLRIRPGPWSQRGPDMDQTGWSCLISNRTQPACSVYELVSFCVLSVLPLPSIYVLSTSMSFHSTLGETWWAFIFIFICFPPTSCQPLGSSFSSFVGLGELFNPPHNLSD